MDLPNFYTMLSAVIVLNLHASGPLPSIQRAIVLHTILYDYCSKLAHFHCNSRVCAIAAPWL